MSESTLSRKEIAEKMLKGIEQTAEVEIKGDSKESLNCITGNAVKIKEPFTGLIGLFYIDNDEHIWQDGQHIIRLGLSFQNIMDESDSGELPENKVQKKKKATKKKKGKDDNISGYF